MERVKTPILENVARLEKLYTYLNYEVSSSILYLGSWFIPMFMPLIFLAAIIFTPYMIFVLYKEKKKGWIIFFFLSTILPIIFLSNFYPSLIAIGLIPFYFFCFILRMTAKEWLNEMRARNELVLQKIRKENISNEFEDIFEMRN